MNKQSIVFVFGVCVCYSIQAKKTMPARDDTSSSIKAVFLVNHSPFPIMVHNAMTDKDAVLPTELERAVDALKGTWISDNEVFVDGRIKTIEVEIGSHWYQFTLPKDIPDGTRLFFEARGDTCILKTKSSDPKKYRIKLKKIKSKKPGFSTVDIPTFGPSTFETGSEFTLSGFDNASKSKAAVSNDD